MALPGPLKWLSDSLYLSKYTTRWIDRWVIFRVWLALWLCAISMLITPVETAGGQAAFLPIILGFLKYPSDPTIIYLAQTALGGVVLCIVWGWCVLGMKLATVARDHDKDQALLQTLQITLMRQNPNPSPAQIEGRLNEAIFTGIFIQAVPAVIYAIFLFVGCYFAFLIRAYNARLFFIMVFSVILLAIYSTLAPLVPQFYAIELGQIFFIPYAYYLAITLFCSIFVMPESVSHAVMEKLLTQTTLLKTALKLSPAQLRTMSDSEIVTAVSAWDATRAGIIQQSDLVSLIAPYLAKEISVQKSSGKDVRRLKEHVRLMSYTLAAQSVFVRHVRRKAAAVSVSSSTEEEPKDRVVSTSDDDSLSNLPYASLPALRQLLQSLSENTDAQQQALIRGVEALSHFIDRETSLSHAIFGLWKQPTAMIEELEAALDGLKDTSVSTEKAEKAAGVELNDTVAPSYLRDLWDAFLFVLSPELENALEMALRIEKRPVKWWWPGKQNADEHPESRPLPVVLSRMRQLRLAMGGQAALPMEEDDPDRINGIGSSTELDVEDGNPKQKDMRERLYGAFHWFTSSVESTFALKVSVLAVALAVPAWVKANGSAHFYYQYKGIWALVSGATAKGLFSGETTYGFIQRILGVWIGGLVALAMWYIGAGSGHGNAYGLAAVFAVTFVFLVPWRIWNPNFLLIVTATTSATLIVGYSWADRPNSPVPTLWNPGQGWEVFWKRELVVLVGCAAAWIIDLIPRPKPGREFIRRTYARTTAELGNITADIIKSIRTSGSDDMYLQNSEELRAISLKLRVTSTRLALAKLEPSLKGRWQPERYAALQRMQHEVVDLLGLLSFISQRLEPSTRTKLLSTPIFGSAQISALTNLFHSTSTALATERPLPAVLPSPHNVSAQYPDLDAELAAIVKEAGTSSNARAQRMFVLAEGTCIQLATVAEQMVAEAQGLFGTNMRWS